MKTFEEILSYHTGYTVEELLDKATSPILQPYDVLLAQKEWEQQVLNSFDVSVSFEHGKKLCDCPECGAEIMYGLSKETMMIVKNSRLFKRK